MHGEGARAGVERGWNVLAFDGPGQYGPIHRERLPFRPDWEKVVTPVVDFALTLPGVDPEKIALMGISMGGYLAPRAAAFEKRISAPTTESTISASPSWQPYRRISGKPLLLPSIRKTLPNSIASLWRL
jgi:alpha-beta hydrolase superfamily lysophospholipase